MKVKTIIQRSLSNLFGYNTSKKIIIFESDDWGSLRINSKETFENLRRKGIKVSDDPYAKYDRLERYDDLSHLFEILDKYRDRNGNPPCITTNFLTANPNFEKIRESNFTNYFYINLNESYEKYSDGQKLIDLLHEGISQKLIYPQFHGREHLNVPLWLRELQDGNEELLHAFEQEVFAVPISVKLNSKKNPTAAFDSLLKDDLQFYKNSIEDGLRLFNDFFGFSSKTMIAPSYIWSENIEKFANENGVKAFQGIPYQFFPQQDGKLKKRFHYTGQKNKLGQYYLVRNAFFEPSIYPNKDWVSECLKRIDLAFKFKKPAIIGMHRLNFIGSLDEKNRTNNLKMFEELLSKISQKWSDVEFVNSALLVSEII